MKPNLFTSFLYPVAGGLMIVAGAAWIYRPLGLLTAGLIMITLALLGQRK